MELMMKKTALLGLVLCLSGCESMNHTEKGLVTGGLLGTGLGAVIGGLAGDAGAGAAIGAFTGLAAGGLAGAAADDREDRDARVRAIAAAEQNSTILPLHEIVRMAQNHFNDDLIITQIRAKNATYNLSTADMEYLASQGVSQRVIQEMISRRAVVVQPVREVIVAEPPPPRVHIGYSYGWGGGCRRCRY